MTGELLEPSETTVYRVCWWSTLLHARQGRRPVRGVDSGIDAGEADRGSDFVNKLELDNEVDKHVVRLDGFSDSDWAGSTDGKSQSGGALFVDGTPLYAFTGRQSVIATSSGMAEFYVGCATAEMLWARDVLMFFGCQVEAAFHMDSEAARGICRREGVGKVNALEVRTLWLQQVSKQRHSRSRQ